MIDSSDAATRLCAACGMCCNGVLFYSMRLQREDSARKLAILGLRAKSRQGGLQIPQPCPAHQDNCCTIYADRPARCRQFDCRQLLAVADGSSTEAAALEKITEAKSRVDRVRALFHQLGDTREHRAFSTRFAAIFTPPLDPAPGTDALRNDLRLAMQELDYVLNRDFRTEPPTS
jgi:Fe-S-cluster containining protein